MREIVTYGARDVDGVTMFWPHHWLLSWVPRVREVDRYVVLSLLACIVIAGVCWYLERSLARRTGLSTASRVVTSDMSAAKRAAAKTLFEPRYKLYGRPDYVLSVRTWRGRRFMPVEVKPTRQAPRPYESDVMELVTYLLLVRATYQRRFAGYGLLRYANATFRVPLTPELERRCVEYAHLVQEAQRQTVHRNHEVRGRCRGCGVRAHCDESLC